jgi:acyl carrier protein
MKEQIKRVMAQTFDIPVSDITDDAEINKLAMWDSLSHMILMLELENEFGVSIPTEKMTTLLSLDQIEAYLQESGMQTGDTAPAGITKK